MDAIKCIGNCFLMFLIAVVFDVLGVILLLIGIFANLRINGLFYGDFLIYTGSLIIFISLACWLMWYVGNVQVSVDDGCKKRNSIVQLARKLSERLTMKLKGREESMKCVEDEESSHGGSSPHKASRVTWGRSTAYSNEGYDTSSDIPDVESKMGKNDTTWCHDEYLHVKMRIWPLYCASFWSLLYSMQRKRDDTTASYIFQASQSNLDGHYVWTCSVKHV